MLKQKCGIDFIFNSIAVYYLLICKNIKTTTEITKGQLQAELYNAIASLHKCLQGERANTN